MKIAGRGSQIAGVLLLAAIAFPASASISVRRSPYNSKTIDLYVVNERASEALGAIQMYLPKTLEMMLGNDPVITYRAREVSPEKALRAITTLAKLTLTADDEKYWIRSNGGEPTVTIDVKDAEARDILKSMQRQCGIKNLMIDPQVQGSGTFLFTQVPCRQAFAIVLQSMGLAAQTYSNNIVSVGAAEH